MEITKQTDLNIGVTLLEKSPDEIFIIDLQNDGIEISLTNIGCAIMSIRTPDKNGVMKNIVAGLSEVNDYRINRDYFGCVVGRYANRIADGKLLVNGISYQLSVNDAPNHLHGGRNDFGHKIWKLDEVIELPESCGVVFSLLSPDGEEGYPGNLQAKVRYELFRSGRFGISYEAVTDKATAVNLTNHSYFNLSGFEEETILGHYLKVNASQYTEKSAGNTSTGRVIDVKGTALDFTRSKKIAEGIDEFSTDMGYDHNFALDKLCSDLSVPAATLSDPRTGRIVNVYTNKPGMQVYSGNYWDGTVTGEQGFIYRKHGGLALETQAWPGSVSHPHFPNSLLQPGEEYRSTTIFEFLTMS